MHFIQAYYTDVGAKRKTNQDSLTIQKARTPIGEVLLAVMCDGMGGHSRGELASKHCVIRFRQWFHERMPVLCTQEITMQSLYSEWRPLVKELNHDLFVYGDTNKVELGTTLTAFLFLPDMFFSVHVGDSRGYLVADQVYQITRDHSLVASEVEKGLLTEEEALRDKRRNVLLESVGITDTIHMDFYSGEVDTEACYFFCCDGFWHNLQETELLEHLDASAIRNGDDLRQELAFLAQEDMNRGEKDNISVIAVIPYTLSNDAAVEGKDTFTVILDDVEIHTGEEIR